MADSEKRRKITFSAADFVVIALAVACIIAAVFRDQIKEYIGEDEKFNVEYVFAVDGVIPSSGNVPEAGESVVSENGTRLGVITKINTETVDYVNELEGTIEVCSLKCTAQGEAEERENGFFFGETMLKPGAKVSAKTEKAKFSMTVISVRKI